MGCEKTGLPVFSTRLKTMILKIRVYGTNFILLVILGTSESRIFDMLTSKLEKLPPFYFGHCDVRDVAKAHMHAAFIPEAAGHRHIIISTDKYISHKVAAEILQVEFGPQGYKISSELEPNEDPNNNADNSRMVKVLGITPTDYKKTIIYMAYSLIAAKNLPLPKNTSTN